MGIIEWITAASGSDVSVVAPKENPMKFPHQRHGRTFRNITELRQFEAAQKREDRRVLGMTATEATMLEPRRPIVVKGNRSSIAASRMRVDMSDMMASFGAGPGYGVKVTGHTSEPPKRSLASMPTSMAELAAMMELLETGRRGGIVLPEEGVPKVNAKRDLGKLFRSRRTYSAMQDACTGLPFAASRTDLKWDDEEYEYEDGSGLQAAMVHQLPMTEEELTRTDEELADMLDGSVRKIIHAEATELIGKVTQDGKTLRVDFDTSLKLLLSRDGIYPAVHFSKLVRDAGGTYRFSVAVAWMYDSAVDEEDEAYGLLDHHCESCGAYVQPTQDNCPACGEEAR